MMNIITRLVNINVVFDYCGVIHTNINEIRIWPHLLYTHLSLNIIIVVKI